MVSAGLLSPWAERGPRWFPFVWPPREFGTGLLRFNPRFEPRLPVGQLREPFMGRDHWVQSLGPLVRLPRSQRVRLPRFSRYVQLRIWKSPMSSGVARRDRVSSATWGCSSRRSVSLPASRSPADAESRREGIGRRWSRRRKAGPSGRGCANCDRLPAEGRAGDRLPARLGFVPAGFQDVSGPARGGLHLPQAPAPLRMDWTAVLVALNDLLTAAVGMRQWHWGFT